MESDSLTVTMTLLDEVRRARAVQASATPGGDGTPLFLETLTGALRDIAQNTHVTHDGLALVETADTVPPTIVQGAFLTLGDGKLIIQGSETILNTSVSFSGMRVTNNTGESTISLDGASLVPSVGSTVNFTIQLTELQRVSVIAISGTPGGDGSATTLDIDPNQVTDVALNPNVAGASVVIHEDPDTIIPFF